MSSSTNKSSSSDKLAKVLAERERRKKAPGYEGYKKKQAAISRARSAGGREIGPLPAVVNPERKEACRTSFLTFCETYFPLRFELSWGEPHLLAIKRMEACTTEGGLYALALPRGMGKTTLAECAALWGVLYGYRQLVVILAATADVHAGAILDSIKAEIEVNDLLAEDFPEACYPVSRLDGINNRATGQTLSGKRTCIEWTNRQIILPTVPRAASSGAIICALGITGSIRGLKITGSDGRSRRPDLVICDDPQTSESAHSATQNASRESTIKKDVLGLAGPKKKIAAIMACTVITPGDLADRMLDRDRNPEWQGERTKLLTSPPSDRALWDRYANLRAESLRGGHRGEEATEFYRANRVAMDAGAEVSWAERFNHDELSAIQHAQNLKLRDESAFQSEYQNDPFPPDVGGDLVELTADEVAAKLNNTPRGTTPHAATRVTAGIDVQGNCLYWMVCGWCEDWSGGIMDYGVWPRQHRAYFAARDARPNFEEQFPALPDTARIYAALAALVPELLHDYPAIERILVDAGWGTSTDAVCQFCRQSTNANILLPSFGRGIVASMIPMREWQLKLGERRGWEWKITAATLGRGRHVTFDTNSWKSFVAERLRTPAAAKGCLWLPGSKSGEHQLLADHITAEYRVKTKGRGREVEEWKIRPQKPDNHWFDTLVLCAVGACVQGLVWSPAEAAGSPPPVPRGGGKKWSEMQKAKRAKS